ncbi:MAG: GGDEF domain-containing protein [Asticcacaulis sp.]
MFEALTGLAMTHEYIVLVMIAAFLLSAGLMAMLLARGHASLCAFMDIMREGVLIVDAGRIVYANRAICRLSGYRAAELATRSLDALFDEQALDGPAWQTRGFDAEFRCADETRRMMDVSVGVLRFHGRLCQVLTLRPLQGTAETDRTIDPQAQTEDETEVSSLVNARLNAALSRVQRNGQQTALLAVEVERYAGRRARPDEGAEANLALRRLRAVAGTGNTVFSVGGDRFLIVQDSIRSPFEADALARRITEGFAFNRTGDADIGGACVGVALFPEDASDTDQLRYNADFALYRAKQTGYGPVCFFSPDTLSAQAPDGPMERVEPVRPLNTGAPHLRLVRP